MKKLLLVSLFTCSLAFNLRAEKLKTLADFQAAADKAKEVLTIPEWPQTPSAVKSTVDSAIAKANAALDGIGRQDLGKVTFQSTIGALDLIQNDANIAVSKAVIIQETNKETPMRDAGEAAVKVYQDWAVGVDYREDVYKAVKAFAETKPKLDSENQRLLEYTLRDYRRAGLALPPEKKAEVE
jgi:thimet oligopeptidase